MELEQNEEIKTPSLSSPIWTKINCQDIGNRWMHTATLYKHYAIVIGGFSHVLWRKIPVIFNLLDYTWQYAVVESDQGEIQMARCGHSACLWEENKIIVFGGNTMDEDASNETLIYTIVEDEETSTITLFCEVAKTTGGEDLYRYRHTANIYNNKMYVNAGADFNNISCNSLWSLDLATMTWSKCKVSGTLPSERRTHSTAIVDHYLYVLFGRTSASSASLNDMWRIDLEKLVWEQLEPKGDIPSPRAGVTVQQFNRCLYIFAGYDHPNYFNDLYKYDIDKNTWTQISTRNKAPKQGSQHASVWYEKSLWICGGGTGGALNERNYFSEIYCLDFEDDDEDEWIANESISSKMKMMLDQRYSDVRFQVGDQEFFGHKVILTSTCPYFENMFESGMIESQADRIQIFDVQPSTFKVFLEYVYCNEVDLSEQRALELLELADRWFMPDLKEKCEFYLTQNITTQNREVLAEIGHRFSAISLAEAAMNFKTKKCS